MIAQLVIILVLATASLVCLWFARINRSCRAEHLLEMTTMIDRLSQHKSQITIRQQALDAYRFQEYNLNEALRPQWEISLDSVN
ncbi:hypothetical protein [Aureitalea marina]|uniref:hypothetical protein n=1 Tax=Aureitalea marina TaxID=930804 RepID=UPI000CF2E4BC|nr:hypothetical protein [Aureitalea marina]